MRVDRLVLAVAALVTEAHRVAIRMASLAPADERDDAGGAGVNVGASRRANVDALVTGKPELAVEFRPRAEFLRVDFEVRWPHERQFLLRTGHGRRRHSRRNWL